MKLAVSTLILISLSGVAWAEDPPQTPEKKTIPGTGGYGWGSGPPQSPPNTPPATGGSLGVQYPPNTETKIRCTRDGHEVPC